MKNIILVTVLIFSLKVNSQVYNSEKCTLKFFSEAKLENIDALNSKGTTLLNTSNGNFAVKATQTDFVFKSSFMQEHYNENYMESEKFPQATIIGKVNETIDYKANGTYSVTITGKLNIHGVEQPRTINGTIVVKDGKIIMDSKFDVKLVDHKIKVPTSVIEKIAEVIQVTYHSELVPKK